MAGPFLSLQYKTFSEELKLLKVGIRAIPSTSNWSPETGLPPSLPEWSLIFIGPRISVKLPNHIHDIKA